MSLQPGESYHEIERKERQKVVKLKTKVKRLSKRVEREGWVDSVKGKDDNIKLQNLMKRLKDVQRKNTIEQKQSAYVI